MSIFVSIACLLDSDVVNTINDCFDKAANPDKITIGVCYQKDYDISDILIPLEQKYQNLRVYRMPWKDAEGPMFARNKILSLIKDEEYFFQIDCHTRFFSRWDEKLIKEYNLCLQQSKHPIISYYPINTNNIEKPKHLSIIYHIATFREISENAIKTSGRIIPVPDQPLMGIGITAAMLFMKCKTVLENPIDPNLPFALHSGEQLLYAIRLWTRGYDFFTPSQHIISTEYITNRKRINIKYRAYLNSKANKYHQDVWKKVKYLLGLDKIYTVPEYLIFPDINDWKEGNVRSLKNYYQMSGIYEKLKALYPNMRI